MTTTKTTPANHQPVTESFVFYYSFADMISKIPDREIRLQAYEMLFDYAMFGIEPQDEHWAVDMVFSAIKPQIDANNKRRANGKKGGRKPSQEIAMPEAKTEEAISQPTSAAPAAASTEAATEPTMQTEPVMQAQSAVQPQQAVLAEPVMQAAPAMQANATVQAEPTMQTEPAAQTAKNGDLTEPLDQIVYFGENKYPTTPRELGHFEEFAYKLFQQYDYGSKPNLADIERVLERTYTRMERPDGEDIAVFDREKADLLKYAFEKAKESGKLNWRYLDGMYRNFAMRDIVTGAEAYQYDLQRQHRFV